MARQSWCGRGRGFGFGFGSASGFGFGSGFGVWAIAIAIGVGGCDRGKALPSKQVVAVRDATVDAAPVPPAFEVSHHVVRRAVPLKGAQLRIVDMQMGRDLLSAAKANGATMAINGGFFDPEFRALGLAVSEHKILSKHTKTPGGVLTVSAGVARLFDAESYDAALETPEFAIQCLPRLVVSGAVNLHRETGKRAERTALCIRDHGRTLEGVYARGRDEAAHPTLLEFAEYLRATGCEDALNLDGGPSSGIVTREGETLAYENPMGVIRHAIVIRQAP
jgi:uncharacterized protein YigE (DUF2233 family)